MKRTISVICIILCLATVLCACDTKDKKSISETIEDAKTSVGTEIEETEEETENVFYNPSNYTGAYDTVDIRPARLYWEDGKLVAECFVINNKSTTAYNINVKKLYFGNEEGTFAEGAFGIMEGASIAPYSYITWTFTFGGDAVKDYGADLTGSIDSGNSVGFNF